MGNGFINSYNYEIRESYIFLNNDDFQSCKKEGKLITNYESFFIENHLDFPWSDGEGFMAMAVEDGQETSKAVKIKRCFYNDASMEFCHKDQNYTISHLFSLIDVGRFCHNSPSERGWRCFESAAAFASIPRICGFLHPIGLLSISYAPMDFGEGMKSPAALHACNMYSDGAITKKIDVTPPSDSTRVQRGIIQITPEEITNNKYVKYAKSIYLRLFDISTLIISSTNSNEIK